MPAADRLVVRFTAGAVGLIAGTMLVACIAGVDVAVRTDTLAPMSPLACTGFIAAAIGALALERRGSRVPAAGGAIAVAAGLAGLADNLLGDGHEVNDALFGVDARVSALAALALVLLG